MSNDNEELAPGPWEKIHRELGIKAPEFDDRPLGAYLEQYAKSIPANLALRFSVSISPNRFS